MTVLQTGLVGLGSAAGGMCRFLLSTAVYQLFGQGFPWGTLAVNLLGSFLAGLLSVLLLQRFAFSGESLRALLMIGFLGGFTTFSSFSLETVSLLENGEILYGFLNMASSIVLCVTLAWLGVIAGRQI